MTPETENTSMVENQAQLRAEVQNVCAAEIIVVDQDTYVQANDLIGKLQTVRKEVVARFADPKKKAAEAHKAICALEKDFLNPLDSRISALKNSTTNWYTAEQARIKAEEDRKRREAEEAAQIAAEAEAQGETELAQEAVIEATMAQASVSTIPKVSGTSMRVVYKAVVVDKNALPREYMMPNQAMIDYVVKTNHGDIQIPGVRIEKTYINSTRAK
ncbi:MAG: hypothetical protein IJT68_06290 [Lentisphaeria bacterium]|nr:hypothetical protein [Lentisphaeria bacterium]